MAEFCTHHSATARVEFKHRPDSIVLLCDSANEGIGTEVILQEIASIVPGHGPTEIYQAGMKVKHCGYHGPFFAKSCREFCPTAKT